MLNPSLNRSIQTLPLWEHDLGVSFTSAEGERKVLGPCSNFQASEIQSYTIENLSQSKYHSFQAFRKKKTPDPSSCDLCWHGCGQVGTLIHLLWHCPAVSSFLGRRVSLGFSNNEYMSLSLSLCLLAAQGCTKLKGKENNMLGGFDC